MQRTEEEEMTWVRSVARKIAVNPAVSTIILDGSLRTGEYVRGYSDVDLKCIVLDRLSVAALPYIASCVKSVSGPADLVANIWTLRQSEFPAQYPDAGFDFVRRHVLRSGYVLEGSDQSHLIELPTVLTDTERRQAIDRVDQFLIRLRRLVTNPLAISDVAYASPRLLLQQACAYLIHACRYGLAVLAGGVHISIESVFREARGFLADRMSTNIIDTSWTLRSSWMSVTNTYDTERAYMYLTQVIASIEIIRDSIVSSVGELSAPISYQ